MTDPQDEVVDLWTAVFGEPPTVTADVSLMVSILVKELPAASYGPSVRKPAESSEGA